MKKTVLLILLVLPIVLLVVIGVAGRIVSPIVRTPVEKVEFIDNYGNVYTEEHRFKVAQGGTAETKILITPEFAHDKSVKYTTNNEKICTVDENGVIYGHHFGETVVTVRSNDGEKIAMLYVKVTADIPYAVYLDHEELTLAEGATQTLEAVVDAPVAVNKRVTFSSNNPDVAVVDAQGKVTAVAPGEAIISVTTVSGGLTDTCKVTVKDDKPSISFDFSGNDAIEVVNSTKKIYVSSEKSINLTDYLVVKEGINLEDVNIILHTGDATLENGVLTFSDNHSSMDVIRAYIGNASNPEFMIEITLVYRPSTE